MKFWKLMVLTCSVVFINVNAQEDSTCRKSLQKIHKDILLYQMKANADGNLGTTVSDIMDRFYRQSPYTVKINRETFNTLRKSVRTTADGSKQIANYLSELRNKLKNLIEVCE